MSIDIRAQVRVPCTLVEALRRAEAYVSPVPHPSFVVLTSVGSASEFQLGPFEVPGQIRDDRVYKESWTEWERGTIEIGAGLVARTSFALAYAARSDEMDLSPDLVEMARSGDEDRGYRAVFFIDRTRGSFCLTLLLAAAIADLSRGRIQDIGGLLKLGEWVEPAAVISLFQRHRGGASFEDLIDAVFDELAIAPGWPTARSELAKLAGSPPR